MKHTKLAGILLASIAFLSIGTAVGVTSFKDSKEVDAAIDITDYTACDAEYNDNDADGLLSALRTITSPGSSKTYDDLWTTYKSCYVKSNGKMFDYYSNSSSFTPGTDQAGSYSKEGDVYNREHSIPKSWWGGSESNQGADPYIVVPTDGYVNGKRSNYPMGMVSSASYTSNNGFSKLGSAVTSWGYTGTVFEPDDSLKGDFARIVFYAIAKYEGSYNWKVDSQKYGQVIFSGNASTNFGLTNYAVKLYSYWNNLDKPDDWERSVNDKVSAIQKNRNPFIDHPEYANVLWGTNSDYTEYETGVGISSISKTAASLTVGGTTTISATSSNSGNITWTSSAPSVATVSPGTQSSGSNVTITAVAAGSATITASITISGTTYSKTCAVTVTNKTLSSISVSGQKTSFTVGDTFSFGGTVTANYSDSSTEDVTSSASFSGYNMSNTGNQTVTVSYGGQTTTYGITVSSSGGTSSESQRVVSKSNSTYFETGSIYLTGSTSSGSATCDAFTVTQSKNSGNNIVYTYDEIRIYQNHSFTITPKTGYTITSVVLTANSSSYASAVGGSSLTNCTKSVNGTLVTLTPTDGTTALGFTNSAQSRINYVTVNYESQSSDTPALSSITLDTSNVQTEFNVGASFNYTGLVVTAHYSDSSSATVTPTSVSTPDLSQEGDETVTVSYTEGGVTKEAFYSIEIVSSAVTTYTVTYNANGGTGTMTDSDSPYEAGDTVTVLDNTFERSGYTFVNWNTESDGSGEDYDEGDTFSISGNMTFYAIWEENVSPTPASGNYKYYKVSSVNDVTTGTYVIAAKIGDTYIGLPNAFANGKITGSSITVTDRDDYEEISEDMTNFKVTITKSGNNYTIYNGTNYLGYGSNTNFNKPTEAYNWLISAGTKGTFRIVSATTTTRGIIYRTGTTNQYGAYATSNVTTEGEYYDVELFKAYTAEDFANSFLTNLVCDASGASAPTYSTGYSWSVLSTEYTNKLTDSEKLRVSGATANESGTVIERAVARYDFIIRKYGSNTYSNFLGRNISQAHNVVFANFTDNSSLIVILIATGIVGVGFVSIVLLKRRKYN